MHGALALSLDFLQLNHATNQASYFVAIQAFTNELQVGLAFKNYICEKKGRKIRMPQMLLCRRAQRPPPSQLLLVCLPSCAQQNIELLILFASAIHRQGRTWKGGGNTIGVFILERKATQTYAWIPHCSVQGSFLATYMHTEFGNYRNCISLKISLPHIIAHN